MAGGRGIVQVYTGDGKGKTTAAWGQVLRGVGRGRRVAVVRFMKPNPSGEDIAAGECLPGVSIFGETSPYDPTEDQRASPILRAESRGNFEEAARLIASGEYDLVVLDELNIVLHYEFLAAEEVLPALADRPGSLDVVITGRYAPDWLISAADLVTEMVELKHPADAGAPPRPGIEF
ncbi:MAG: cob(I)yrinic acid a,c-diamide adenosyltransferase [Armatimonadetes bacterium]|nr:cob(I)yrinic acid a,c-diamide adenosyltransferase [Armatimonadota bacterium]